MPPRRARAYRVVIEGPAPEDLAERCAQVWRDVRLAAQHAVGARRTVDLILRAASSAQNKPDKTLTPGRTPKNRSDRQHPKT